MASAGGSKATDEIREVEMEIVEQPPEEPTRVGSKRVRDSSNGEGSHGFRGVTTSEKKAAISNHMDMNSDGTYKIESRYMHGTPGERTLPDYNALRTSISSPGYDYRWNSRDTFPRSLDGGIFQSAADKGTYLDMNYRSFDLSIPSDPLQHNDKLSAYGGTTGNLPNTHHKEHLSGHVPYCSYSLPDFKNPLYATSHLGRLPQHLPSPVMEKVGPHTFVDVDTGTSRLALLASSSPQPSIISPGLLTPIKEEVWETSVPFVPSIDIPDIKVPPRKYIDSPQDDSKSSSISSQHAGPYVLTPESLDHDGKLAKNMSAKRSNGHACLMASDKVCGSSLDDNNRVKVDNRKPGSASYNEKTKTFRFRLAEHVKKLIAPIWKEGYLSKEAHKLVVKKCIDKVLSSIELHQVPTSEEAITDYITISKLKIERLVKAYVNMHVPAEIQSS